MMPRKTGKSVFKTGIGLTAGSRFLFSASALLMLAGCTLFASRPTQLMSDTSAAIRAAKNVQAETLAPELFRQANEWFFRAKHEYKFKNFKLASDYATKARSFAERAEFQSLKNGGKFVEPPPPQLPPAPTGGPPPPDMYATPTPVSAERMEMMENQKQGGGSENSANTGDTGNNGPVPLGALPSP